MSQPMTPQQPYTWRFVTETPQLVLWQNFVKRAEAVDATRAVVITLNLLSEVMPDRVLGPVVAKVDAGPEEWTVTVGRPA